MPAAEVPTQTFQGDCDLLLTVTNDPPLTSTPAPGSARAQGTGTCTGVLTDESGHTENLDGAPVRLRAAGTGDLSCGGGNASGEGVLSFGRAQIDYAFDEVRGPGSATLSYTGAAGGSALALASVSPDQDPVETVSTCADTGLREVRVVVNLLTNDLSG